MSDASQPPTDPAANDNRLAAAGRANATKPKRPRRWLRKIGITLAVMLTLAVVFRIALIFLLPTVLNRVAGIYGLNCTYERLEISLLGGDVGVWHLHLTPGTGGEPILKTGYVRGNISTLALLAGRLDVWRAEVDGVDVSVDREADGSIPLLRQLMSGGAPAPAAEAKPQAATRPTMISLKPPLTLDALRVQRVRVRLRDKTLNPPLVSELRLDVRVSDVGSAVRPTQFQIDANFDPIFDTIRIDGEGRADGRELNAKVRIAARGVRVREAAPYLAALGIKPVANEISAKMAGSLKVTLLPATNAESGVPNAEASAASDAVALNLSLDGMALEVDGKEAAAADKVSIDVSRLTIDEASVTKIEVDGVRAAAGRTADGNLLAAGAEIVTLPVKSPSSAPAVAPTPAATVGATSPIKFRATLGELLVKNVRADFVDAAVTPVVNLAAVVQRFSLKDVVFDAEKPDAAAMFEAELGVPGVVRSVAVTGTMKPFAAKKTLAIKVSADGIRPDAIKPYLDPLGIESEFDNGKMTAHLDASVALEGGAVKADAEVGKIVLHDKNELLTFDGMTIAGATIDPAKSLVRVDSIDVAGPSISGRRNADGGFSAVGLRLKGASTRPVVAQRSVSSRTVTTAPAATALVASPQAPPKLPTIEIGRFTWKGIRANLQDATTSPPTTANLADARIEVAGLRLTFDPADPTPSRGTIRAWLSAPGSADKLAADGSISSTSQGATIDLAVTGGGLRGELLRPYIAPFGVEPTLQDGSLRMQAKLAVAQSADELKTSLLLKELTFTDAGTELIGVDAVELDGVALRAGELSVARIGVDKPRARVTRDADGSFFAAGLRYTPSTQPAVMGEQLAAKPARPQAAGSVAADPPTTAPPFVVRLGSVRLNEGSIQWTDRATNPNIDTTATASVEVRELVVGRPSEPAIFRLDAKVKDSLDAFTLAGVISPSPDAPTATLKIAGSGIRAGRLAAYLPPGIAVPLKDGNFSAGLDVAMGKHPAGGQSGKLVVSNLTYGDGAARLFKLDAAKLIVSRIDLPDVVLAIDTISVSNVEADVKKAADGSIEALGVSLKAPANPAAVRTPRPDARLASLKVAPAVAPPGGEPVDVADVTAAMIASKKKPLPLVTLDTLDLGVKRFTFTDLSRAESAPVSLSDLSVKNVSRIEMLGTDAASRPPVKMRVTGKVDPLFDSLLVDLQASPFAQQPNLAVDVVIAGIHGDGLTALMPELKDKVGSTMTNGRFDARLEVTTKFDRRTPLDFDLSRGFELSFLARDVALRSTPDGPILAGFESIESEGARVRPDVGGVHVKSLDLTKPVGLIVREPDGIHALGWIVKLPKKGETAAPTTVTVGPEAPAPQAGVPAPDAESEKPRGEIRIDRLTVSGLDFRVEDRSVQPTTVVPLTDLDVEVKGLSNWALYEETPIRFSAAVSAGKVLLPKVERGGGGIIGLIGALDQKKPDAPATRQFEERDLMSQALASGQLTLHPTPKGWLKSSVSGFELSSIEGTAKDVGVVIGGGVFDSNIDLRFDGDGTAVTRSKFTFTDLSVSEPPDGFIARYLKLPAGLDVIVDALRAADGSLGVPVSTKINVDGSDPVGSVLSAAPGAIGAVIGTAFVNAPLKAVQGVGAIVGLDSMLDFGRTKNPLDDGPIIIAFEPGSTAAPVTPPELARLLERMKNDKALTVTIRGQLGAGDVSIAQRRANPSPADCMSLQGQLRDRKSQLLAIRAETLGQSRGQSGSGYGAAAGASVQRLRAIDRELAEIEDSLDKLYEILRPGADRQAGRRTRAACLDIAKTRLDELREALLATRLPDIQNRVTVINATFNPADDTPGGRVTLVPVMKK